MLTALVTIETPTLPESAKAIVQVGEIITVGSSKLADYEIPEESFSGIHIRFSHLKRGLFVETMSDDSVFQFKGQLQSRARLQNGDEIKLGNCSVFIDFFGDHDDVKVPSSFEPYEEADTTVPLSTPQLVETSELDHDDFEIADITAADDDYDSVESVEEIEHSDHSESTTDPSTFDLDTTEGPVLRSSSFFATDQDEPIANDVNLDNSLDDSASEDGFLDEDTVGENDTTKETDGLPPPPFDFDLETTQISEELSLNLDDGGDQIVPDETRELNDKSDSDEMGDSPSSLETKDLSGEVALAEMMINDEKIGDSVDIEDFDPDLDSYSSVGSTVEEPIDITMLEPAQSTLDELEFQTIGEILYRYKIPATLFLQLLKEQPVFAVEISEDDYEAKVRLHRITEVEELEDHTVFVCTSIEIPVAEEQILRNRKSFRSAMGVRTHLAMGTSRKINMRLKNLDFTAVQSESNGFWDLFSLHGPERFLKLQ